LYTLGLISHSPKISSFLSFAISSILSTLASSFWKLIACISSYFLMKADSSGEYTRSWNP